MTSKIVTFGFVAGLVLASAVHAQTPVEKPADPPKAADFSPAEKTAIDVLSLMSQRDQALKDLGTCSGQLASVQAKDREAQLRERVMALKQQVEKAHPGFRWDLEKGTLVPDPPKAPAPAKP